VLRLPRLKHLSISGICELSNVLNASPHLDTLDIHFDCLRVLLDSNSAHCLLQTGIKRLIIRHWMRTEADLVQHIIQIFGSLDRINIIMNYSTSTIDSFVVAILPFTKDKIRVSLSVEGSLSEEASTNIRQWIIDHSHLTAADSFAVRYCNNCFQLWL
jgi:hypothetical protein